MKIGLQSVASYLPGETLNVGEYYKYLKPEVDKLAEEERSSLLDTAPAAVHRLKDPSALEHIALCSAQKALDAAGLQAGSVAGLLVTQTGGKQFMPLLATYLQLNLGLRKDIIARNVSDNNVSIHNILNLSRVYVKSGLCKKVLIVAAAAQIGGKYGFGADLTEPWSMHLGDGGAAALVSSEDLKCEMLGYHIETYAVTPRTTGTLNGDYGAVRRPNNRALCFDAEMNDTYGAFLNAYDPKLREIAGGKSFLSDTLGRAARKAGLRLEDIDHIVTAHIGDLLGVWCQDLIDAGLNPKTLKTQQQTVGNTACADTLIDLAGFNDAGMFSKGDVIALITPCTGVQVAVNILKWL